MSASSRGRGAGAVDEEGRVGGQRRNKRGRRGRWTHEKAHGSARFEELSTSLPLSRESRATARTKNSPRAPEKKRRPGKRRPWRRLRGLTSARRQESPFSRRASPEALCVTPVPSSLPRQKGPPHLFFSSSKTSPTKSAGEVGFVARELDIQIGVRERAASTTREVRRLWRGVVAPQRNSRGVVHGSGTARCCSARRAWARCA